MDKVFIGSPVRNRGWILPRHLESVIDQEVEKEFCYIVNDCTDNTEDVLRKYGIDYVIKDLSTKYGHVRGLYSIQNLATLRNFLLDEFLESDCDYLFSIDTDIIIPEDSIQQLINRDKDIISMLIRNHPTSMAHNIMMNGKHLPEISANSVIPVDMTGAVYLIKRKVIEAGVRYGFAPKGEDFPFCEQALKNGFQPYCDTSLKPIHAYTEDHYLLAETKGD